MSDLRELYQQMILEHSRKPRNFRVLERATRQADGDNPLCGDRLTVYVDVDDGVVRDVSFEGSGCAISRASASLMTEAVKGKRVEEVREMFSSFHHMLTSDMGTSIATDELGKLAVFSGVREFPVRVKCATLAWHTLKAALEGAEEPVTTE